MKAALIASVVVTLASTSVFAQDTSHDKSNQQPSQMQRDHTGVAPTAQMGNAAKGGVSPGTSGSGKLMQGREQGMSPNGTQPGSAGGNSTGTMKQ